MTMYRLCGIAICSALGAFQLAATLIAAPPETEPAKAPKRVWSMLYLRGPSFPPPSDAEPLESKLYEAERAVGQAKTRADRLAFRRKALDIMEQLTLLDVGADEWTAYVHRYAMSLASAAFYGDVKFGLDRLEKLRDRLRKSGDLEALADADLRLIRARHTLGGCCPEIKGLARFAAWPKHLREFIERYPSAPVTAEASWELAQYLEKDGQEEEPRKLYTDLVTRFLGSDEAALAEGALSRFDSVGKIVELPVLERPQFADRPVILHFWYPSGRGHDELDVLERLNDRLGDTQIAIVSIALCSNREELAQQIAWRPLSWTLLQEDRSEYGPLYTQFGIAAYPTIMLLDRDHRVVNRRVDATKLEAEVDGVLKPAE